MHPPESAGECALVQIVHKSHGQGVAGMAVEYHPLLRIDLHPFGVVEQVGGELAGGFAAILIAP